MDATTALYKILSHATPQAALDPVQQDYCMKHKIEYRGAWVYRLTMFDCEAKVIALPGETVRNAEGEYQYTRFDVWSIEFADI